MTRASTSRAEYTRRMNQVLDHIDAHLDAPLDLPTLAAVAHFSPFHFHRLFAAWMGETLGEYLRRRRLEIAAIMLASQRDVPVTNIALDVGFGSVEAFARAFKARFACTPSAWRAGTDARWRTDLQARRARRKHDQGIGNPDQAHRNSDQAPGDDDADDRPSRFHSEGPTMDVQFVDRHDTRIAYLRHIGPYGPAIGRFLQATFEPWAVANGLAERPRYGISHDDPSITAPDKCRYDAAIEVPEGFVANGGAVTTTLPGGRYAAARFSGNATQIGDAWAELFRDWLPASGMQCDARPCFEVYTPAQMAAGPDGFACLLCVPVVRL